MGIIGKAVGAVKGFFQHWNTPAEGDYVSSKEVVAYSVGGIGVQFVAAMAYTIAMTANCILVGSIYQITPGDLFIISTINTIVTIIMQPLKSYWIDNTPGGKGKARPYLLWLGPPCAILISLFAFIPMGWSYAVKVAVVGILFIVMNFIFQFYLGMYNTLAQLITPSSGERAKIISLSSIVYSMAPTITGFILPLISNAFDRGQLDVNFYRVTMPLFSFLGCFLAFIVYFCTKERVVVPRDYQQKIKFADGMKKIVRNRYFWIYNISTWFTTLAAAITTFMQWAYIYMLQNATIQSFMTLIVGTASLFGMALAPIMIKKVGKRNAVLISDAFRIVGAVILIFYNTNFYVFTAACYLIYWGAAVQIITNPAMNGDALDYQQWKTGDRMEGFSGNFTIINSLVLLGLNYVIPYINEYYGLLNDYDVLYDASIYSPMFTALSIVTVVGVVLHALPIFFWNMSEEDQANMIEDLKERARKHNEETGYHDASILSSGEMTGEEHEDGATADEVQSEARDLADAEFAAGATTGGAPSAQDKDNGGDAQ